MHIVKNYHRLGVLYGHILAIETAALILAGEIENSDGAIVKQLTSQANYANAVSWIEIVRSYIEHPFVQGLVKITLDK